MFTAESFCNAIWETSYSKVSQSVTKEAYKEFEIPKKGGSRVINYLDRNTEMWNLQQKLLRNFLEKQSLPVCVKGFRQGESYRSFLSEHIGSKFFLRIDISSFFPSVKEAQIKDELSRLLACDSDEEKEKLLNLICAITTLNGSLPQGASTSPAISNLVMARIDQRITKYCQVFDIRYSRYGVASIDDDCFDKFFSDYLSYCKMQNFSRSWMDNTIAALRLFLLAVHSSNTQNIKSINAETINCFSTAMSNASEICMNVRRARCRQVGAYLHWLYDHKYTDLDYSLQLPNFKRTAPQIPQVWSPEEIDKILAVIDTANPVGRRNYAIFLLLARTGLRISDVLGLKFSNINWKENCISLSQQKTGNALSLPLSKELGMAIISYLQDGRPQSSSAFIFLSHNAPFQPLGEHNNFNPEFHKYLRRAGIAIPTKRHTGVHTIRHSFATNMLRKGTPVQDVSQILGHSNISVTETYLRVDIEHMRLCSLSLEGLL